VKSKISALAQGFFQEDMQAMQQEISRLEKQQAVVTTTQQDKKLAEAMVILREKEDKV
jgi:hypothetical protein